MDTLPACLKLQLFETVARSGQSFHSLILTSKSFNGVYTAYSQVLDEALVTASVGNFLPFAWLLATENGVEDWNKRTMLQENRLALGPLSVKDQRSAYRVHATIKAIGRNLHAYADFHKTFMLEKEADKEKYRGRIEDPVQAAIYFNSAAFLFGVYQLVITERGTGTDEQSLGQAWKDFYLRCWNFVGYVGPILPSPIDIVEDYVLKVGLEVLGAEFEGTLGEYDITMADFAWSVLESFENDLEGLYKFIAGYSGTVTEEQRRRLVKCAAEVEAQEDEREDILEMLFFSNDGMRKYKRVESDKRRDAYF